MKLTLKLAVILSGISILFLAAPIARADDSELFQACSSTVSSKATGSPICADKGTQKNPAIHIIQVASSLVALLAGIAAVIIVITSGLSMITSSGNQESVTNARKRLTAAVIGLVIIAFAWVIVKFLTDRLIKT
ncbi:MAG TPA: pilin [Candidatus Saccharimonadales bacterium]|nr:pilin [Candidatus Saccharimonadales bacterium]